MYNHKYTTFNRVWYSYGGTCRKQPVKGRNKDILQCLIKFGTATVEPIVSSQ